MSGVRLFFALCVLVSGLLVISVLIGTPASADAPPEVTAGLAVWRGYKCEGCHPLFGQGGPYAPDLTHIYRQRGDTYLREFLLNPGAFHPGQRIMPAPGLTVSETDSLLAFLDWVGAQPAAAKWPPRPIQISGGGRSGVSAAPSGGANIERDPAARGKALFAQPPAICSTCHSLEPNVTIVGPSLAGVAGRARTRVAGQSAEAYLRNSIINPSDFIVPGFQDVMQKNLGDTLTAAQINDIIAFLLTLK
jgi:nitric oxide reductase subunit C